MILFIIIINIIKCSYFVLVNFFYLNPDINLSVKSLSNLFAKFYTYRKYKLYRSKHEKNANTSVTGLIMKKKCALFASFFCFFLFSLISNRIGRGENLFFIFSISCVLNISHVKLNFNIILTSYVTLISWLKKFNHNSCSQSINSYL